MLYVTMEHWSTYTLEMLDMAECLHPVQTSNTVSSSPITTIPEQTDINDLPKDLKAALKSFTDTDFTAFLLCLMTTPSTPG